MQTRPTEFANNHIKRNVELHWILEVDDGTGSWLFSDIDMRLTDGHVHALLADDIDVEASFEPLTKRFETANLEFSLLNADYKVESGAKVKLSDEVGTWQFADISLYLAAGRAVTALTDCLLKFSGTIVQPPKYDEDAINIKAVDNLTLADKIIPSLYLLEDYPDPPEDNADGRKQIIYGDFRRADDSGDIHLGTGLAKALLCTKDAVDPLYFVAGHKCDIINPDIYFDVGGPSVVLAQKGTEEIFGPITSDPITAIPVTSLSCNQRYEITDTIETGYSIGSPYSGDLEDMAPTNPENAHDDDYSTYATIADNLLDNGANNAGAGAAVFGILNQDDLRGHLRQSTGVSLSTRYKACYRDPGFSSTSLLARTRLYYAKPSSASVQDPMPTLANTDVWYVSSGVAWSIADIEDPLLLMLLVTISGVGTNDLDGTVDNQTIFRVGELQLQVNFDLDDYPMFAWANVRGLEYDSWINSRSSNYSETEYIRDPAGIIESILRDWLGLTSSDIDLTSFIAAENTSVEARINVTSDNKRKGTELVRKIAEQSTVAFCFTADGKARLVPLNNASPTSATRNGNTVKIRYDDLADGSLSIEKSEDIFNQLNIDSRWQAEYDRYRDNALVENSTSQTAYGILRYDAEWECICGDSATHVANHLVGNSNGIWANQHNVVSFATVGALHADIELGDWIEFDSGSMDARLKCFGESWSGKQFLVTSVRQSIEQTEFVGIELY